MTYEENEKDRIVHNCNLIQNVYLIKIFLQFGPFPQHSPHIAYIT